MQEAAHAGKWLSGKEGGVHVTSAFLKVRCECKNEQVVFSKASSQVTCLVCGKLLAKATGGKAMILGEQLEVLE